MHQKEQEKKYKIVHSTMGNYKVIKTLGKGGTSKVKLGQHIETNDYVALKILRKKYVNQAFDQIQKEINAMQACSHPNIIKILDLMQDVEYKKPSGKTTKETVLVLELAPNGELIDYIMETGRFSEPICRYILQKILGALNHLHSKGYCNRDLKPENIFIGKKNELKMADLGFATLLNGKDGSGKLYTPLGTPGYVAPEIILGEAYSGVLVDLFACGVINYIMVAAMTPFNHAMKSDQYYGQFMTNPDFYWKVQKKFQDDKDVFSDEFIDLMNKMLAFDPKDRLQIEAILKHPWMQGKIATDKEVQKEFEARKTFITQQHYQQMEMKTIKINENNMAKEGKIFRNLDERDQLSQEYEQLEIHFPNIRSKERTIEKFHNIGASINVHYIKINIEDLTDFLLCVLRQQCKTVYLDDDEYTISCTFDDKIRECLLNINITQVDEQVLAIEFIKETGYQMYFCLIVKKIKNFISLLQEPIKVVKGKEEKVEKQEKQEEQEEQEEVIKQNI